MEEDSYNERTSPRLHAFDVAYDVFRRIDTFHVDDPRAVDDFEARRHPIDDVVETELSCYRSFRPTYKVLTSAHFSPERSDRTSVDDVQELETEAYARYGDVVERSEAV